MYEAYFQFQGCPFPATPIVANYFPAQSIESARQALMRVVERAEGPGFVVGPTGVGKSLLLRALAEHFAEAFRVVLLSGTRVSTRKSLLQSILFELGLPYRGMDEGELRLALIDALRPSDKCPNGILLLVDEAHTLPLRLLDEIRMMTNVVRDGQPRARLILAGGPSLEERFANPKVESLSQRIAARCYLHSLTRDETIEYVRAQLSWVGGDPDVLLAEDAPRAIYQASDGIPRLINQICDHAFLLAEARELPHLTGAMIQEAWADLQQLPPPWQNTRAESAESSHTVVEFGELSDVPPTTARDEQPGEHWGELDPLPWLAELPNSAADVDTTVVVAYAEGDNEVQWFDGVVEEPAVEEPDVEEPAVEEPELAHNPFADPFEEEVVVIDQTKANEMEAFRGRRRVSCLEGRKMLAGLMDSLRDSNQVTGPAGPEHRPVPTLTESTFESIAVASSEYSVDLSEPIPAEVTATRLVDDILDVEMSLPSTEQSIEGVLQQIEHDLDEEIESVPLPWTRPAPGDDRDVIIVEEDVPEVNVYAGDEGSDRPRRLEYRELFAQLRRASD
ncbi:MAG: ExeA family protein [Pirellulaceae bacterium]